MLERALLFGREEAIPSDQADAIRSSTPTTKRTSQRSFRSVIIDRYFLPTPYYVRGAKAVVHNVNIRARVAAMIHGPDDRIFNVLSDA